MTTAEVDSGICGYSTTVRAKADGREVLIEMQSSCPHVQSMAEELTAVQPFSEISLRGEAPETLRVASKHLAHAACPVPAGVIKAIEVEAGLALPKEATIRLCRD